jgi:ABC-2 type transport system ATP-binding protein
MVANALEVHNATKVFARGGASPLWRRLRRRSEGGEDKITSVNDVSLEVKRGEIFGVVGPNGSGKSTLVRLVATLLIPDAGEITIFGHSVRDETAVKRMINRVSVDAAFFKKLSPMENLIYGARLYGLGGRQAREQIVEILTRLGIEERSIWEPMEKMSRGMQQKVAIARAFLTAPVLLLLDEPTSGLDPRSKREVQDFVLEVRSSHEATILLTTHDMREAEQPCDRIAIMDRGRIVALDTLEGLKGQAERGNGTTTLEDVFMELTGREYRVEEDKQDVFSGWYAEVSVEPGPGLLWLRGAEFQPGKALLGLGGGLADLWHCQFPLHHLHWGGYGGDQRIAGGYQLSGSIPPGGHAGVEVSIGAVPLHQRDDRLGALGGHH